MARLLHVQPVRYSSVFGAINDATHDGISSITPDKAKAGILDPDVWAQEGFDLAKQIAYADPVRTDTTPVTAATIT